VDGHSSHKVSVNQAGSQGHSAYGFPLPDLSPAPNVT
jgi:hypothetical protein